MVYKPPTLFIDDDALYPESDGQPVGENTTQFRLIMMIHGGLDTLFKDVEDVFVAGDLFWYPVRLTEEEISQEKKPSRLAPDVMVIFGVRKKDRPSYKQWEEDDITPQVVFEIISPSNSKEEMQNKFEFYQTHGVEEYYAYNPKGNRLEGWLRSSDKLEAIPEMEGWTSPRLGVKFTTRSGELRLFAPDGEMFASYVDLASERDRERLEKERERLEKELESQRANSERRRANAAESERDRERLEKERAQDTVEKLRDRLRELGVDPDKIE